MVASSASAWRSRLGAQGGFLFQPWVVLGALSLCGAAAVTAPLAALSLGLCWLALFVALAHPSWSLSAHARGGRLLLLGLALIVAQLSFWRARVKLSDYKESTAQMRASFVEPLRCVGRGQVDSSPLIKTRKGSDGSGPESVQLYRVRAAALDCAGHRLKGPILVQLAAAPLDLARGDELEIYAQLAPLRLFRNTGLPNPWLGAARAGALLSGSVLDLTRLREGQGLSSYIDRFRSKVRRRIDATYSKVTAPLGRALVLGESDLPGEDAEAFRHSGLLHLLAVSGTHLVIFVLSLVRLLRAILVRIQPLARKFDVSACSATCGAVMSLLYADFSGGSGSAWRAAYMLCAVCGARSFGLRMSGPTALGVSLLIGVGIDPLAPGDYSFLLSALATAGLIGLGQPLSRLLLRGAGKREPFRFLIESLSATLASTIPCAPVMAMMSGKMTWAALFANVVAAPLGEVIALPACLLHAFVSPWPAIESGLALIGSGALYGVRATALLSASLSMAQFSVPFPSSAAIALAVSGYLVAAYLYAQGRSASEQRRGAHLSHLKLVVTGGAVWCLGWAHSPEPRGASNKTLSLTALDVGQGDALLLRFGNEQVALLDGGGFATKIPDTGERVILPFLRSRGIDHLDLMILSHAHPDHISGLLSVAESVPVRTLWLPQGDRHRALPRRGSIAQLARSVKKKGGTIRYSGSLCDELQSFGGAQIEVLAPCAPTEPPLGLNDDSLVLRVRYGSRSALLTGDIEEQGEARLLRNHAARLRADLLKVAHHGSDTSSSPAFIAAVAPQHALISSGVRNRFRHPRPQTLQTLEAQGVQVLRTDQQGSLHWSTDGQTVQIRSFDALVLPPPLESSDLLGLGP